MLIQEIDLSESQVRILKHLIYEQLNSLDRLMTQNSEHDTQMFCIYNGISQSDMETYLELKKAQYEDYLRDVTEVFNSCDEIYATIKTGIVHSIGKFPHLRKGCINLLSKMDIIGKLRSTQNNN